MEHCFFDGFGANIHFCYYLYVLYNNGAFLYMKINQTCTHNVHESTCTSLALNESRLMHSLRSILALCEISPRVQFIIHLLSKSGQFVGKHT